MSGAEIASATGPLVEVALSPRRCVGQRALHGVLFFSLALTSATAPLQAQQERRYAVSGKVSDATSGLPLALVNVFVAHSTIGAASDDSGHFLIRGIPEGHFDLVASRIGYAPASIALSMPRDDGGIIHFALEPTVVEIPPIEVRAADLAQWRADLVRFREAFVGTSANARKTVILNPEVLDFVRDPQSKTLRAVASASLEIVNRGLGYRIHAVLVSFALSGESSHYQAKAQFIELRATEQEEAKSWVENRVRAYRGSFRHFLSALVAGRTKEEGFSVWRTPKLYSYRQVSYESRAKQAQLFSPGEEPFTVKLHFPGFLKVMYLLEPDEFTQASYQVSLIKLSRDTVVVNVAGYSPDPGDMVRYGRWSHDRLAEQLPFDYVPPR